MAAMELTLPAEGEAHSHGFAVRPELVIAGETAGRRRWALARGFEHRRKKLEDAQEQLTEALEELDASQTLCTDLTVRDRRSNDELQMLRMKIINHFPVGRMGNATIGVKRMSEIDKKAFITACRSKPDPITDEEEATILLSQLEADIANPNWHPFRMIQAEGDFTQVINENDPTLRNIQEAQGKTIYSMVTTALCQIDEFNRSGGYPIPVLWNYREGREATLDEAVDFIMNKCDRLKRKRQIVD
ncbi:hypothetical protein EJB05_07176, partial [Eragrostis curvula]